MFYHFDLCFCSHEIVNHSRVLLCFSRLNTNLKNSSIISHKIPWMCISFDIISFFLKQKLIYVVGLRLYIFIEKMAYIRRYRCKQIRRSHSFDWKNAFLPVVVILNRVSYQTLLKNPFVPHISKNGKQLTKYRFQDKITIRFFRISCYLRMRHHDSIFVWVNSFVSYNKHLFSSKNFHYELEHTRKEIFFLSL